MNSTTKEKGKCGSFELKKVSMLLLNGGVAMTSSGSTYTLRDLHDTSTWLVVCIYIVFILISMTLEASLHKTGMWPRATGGISFCLKRWKKSKLSCFFRQFYRYVDKVDYLTLHKSFITVHLSPRSKFNFQKYIKRSVEDDFKIFLAIGTKLQAILEKMIIDITRRHSVIQGGIPLFQVSDKYFWFDRPELLLHLIHFVLFQVNNLLNNM